MTPTDFAEAIRLYCAMTRASVTSWGRTAVRNGLVGGVSNSAHLYFLAVDVVYDAAPDVERRKTTALRLGLRLIVEDDHDHLQPAEWPAG